MIDTRSSALNYVVIAGKRSPGVVRISGAEQIFNWDIQTGYALDGARTIFKGRGVAHPTLTFTLAAYDDVAAWSDFRSVFKPPSDKQPFWIMIDHPIFSDAEIGKNGFGVEKVGSPERGEGGPWIVTVNLVEYRPPIQNMVKPRGSIPAESGAPPVPPQTAADKALVENSARLQALRGG